jgi:hypothetical protein
MRRCSHDEIHPEIGRHSRIFFGIAWNHASTGWR